VNERTQSGMTIAEILRGFNSWQRQWYLRTLRDVAPIFGYDLDGGVALIPHCMAEPFRVEIRWMK
jgi:hypothetical protein